MTIRIQTGTLSDFFDSARETAREIDRGERPAPRNTIWVEPADMIRLSESRADQTGVPPAGRDRIILSDLAAEMKCAGPWQGLSLSSSPPPLSVFSEDSGRFSQKIPLN